MPVKTKKEAVKKESSQEKGVKITSIKGTVRTFAKLTGKNLYYEFASGRQLEVFNPKYINTDKGCHRIICADGTCLFVDPINGWFTSWINYDALDEDYRF